MSSPIQFRPAAAEYLYFFLSPAAPIAWPTLDESGVRKNAVATARAFLAAVSPFCEVFVVASWRRVADLAATPPRVTAPRDATTPRGALVLTKHVERYCLRAVIADWRDLDHRRSDQ